VFDPRCVVATGATSSYAGGILPSTVSVPALVDDDMITRRVGVPPRQVVFVKSIFEASEGVGVLFAERGGELLIAAPVGRERDLDELLADLEVEIGAVVSGWDGAPAPASRRELTPGIASVVPIL
jgi:hypothetical protein